MGVGERLGMGPVSELGTSSMCVGSCCLGVCWGLCKASTHDVIKVSDISVKLLDNRLYIHLGRW